MNLGIDTIDEALWNDLTIPDLVASVARGNGQGIVLDAPGRRALSYQQLLAQISCTAAVLRTVGVNPGKRVAVVLPNGPEMAALFVAITAHTSCAPLNPAYNERELAFYLDDLDCGAIVVARGDSGPARTVAESKGLTIIELESDERASAGGYRFSIEPDPGTIASARPATGDEALVLHTSGTTSRPKIVPLSHGNLCASAGNVAASLALTERDSCLNLMPLFHIHGLVAGLLATIASGGRVVCTPGCDPGRFSAWLAEHRPTWYTAVPTMHQAILAAFSTDVNVPSAPSLRFIRSSSAALPPTVMEELEHTFSAPVIEAYGMTEAAHQMTANPLPPGQRKVKSVGLAAGPEVGVIDSGGELLGPEQIGEVVIRGANVMAGYADNPQANAEAFSGGWFRTGDQGRFDAEGYLYITGRLKEIINRGGEKISPREIDEVLMEHADVRQAVAFAVPHDSLGEDIAAAVVVRAGSALTEDDLRAFAFQNLAPFKVPTQVVFLPELPKGPTGKLQRIGLADKLGSLLEKAPVAPKDELERLVVETMAEVLGLEQVGAQDNFFAIGGNSLTGTQVVSRLRQAFQVQLPLVAVFEYPTATALAGELRKLSTSEDLALVQECLEEIDSLTDAEVEELLKAEIGRGPLSGTAR